MVLRLVRRDWHHLAWRDVCLRGPVRIRPHECSITGSKQEVCIHECAKQGITGGAVEPPKPLGLSRGEAEPWHLDVLTLDAMKNVGRRLMRCGHGLILPSRVPSLCYSLVAGERASEVPGAAQFVVARASSPSHCGSGSYIAAVLISFEMYELRRVLSVVTSTFGCRKSHQ